MTDTMTPVAKSNEALTLELERAAAERLARIEAGTEPMPVQGVYHVLDPMHLAALRQKCMMWGRKAVRMGGLPVTLWEAPAPEWIDRPRPDGTMARIRVRQVAILGDVPDTGSWRYLACLRHSEPGTVVQRAWGSTDASDEYLAGYRARGPVCDHCEMRRVRNDTYVIRHRETGETVQVGSACLEQYCSGSPEAAVYAFDVHASMTQMVKSFAALDDAVRAEEGIPVLDALAGLLGGDVGVAQSLIDEATRTLLPSLVEERRMEVYRLAGLPTDWDPSIARLPGALHNATVMLAEGFVSYRNRDTMRSLVRWYRDAADRLTRERLASDDAMQMTMLGLTALPSTALELARMLADGTMRQNAAKLLAALDPQSAPVPTTQAVAGNGVDGMFKSLGGGAWGVLLNRSAQPGEKVRIGKRSGAVKVVTLRDKVGHNPWSLA